MKLTMTIDIDIQDLDGNHTQDCIEAEKEFRKEIKSITEMEGFYSFKDLMREYEKQKTRIEEKYEVLIIRNLKSISMSRKKSS